MISERFIAFLFFFGVSGLRFAAESTLFEHVN